MDSKTQYLRSDVLDKKKRLRDKKKNDKWLSNITLSWVRVEMDEDRQQALAKIVMKELKQSEDALGNILSEFVDVKKAYLDNEKKDDPMYVDYNLLFNNVDMMMALGYANEMSVKFKGSIESDMYNADIISKTAEHDYKWEMDMANKEYELWIDKFLWWCACVIWDWWNSKTQSPIPVVAPVEFFRPDPRGWWSVERYRFIWFFWYMTKYQMRQQWFSNVDEVTEIEWKDDITWYSSDNGTNITLPEESSEDDFSI